MRTKKPCNCSENYLERIPSRAWFVEWNKEDCGRVTLHIRHDGAGGMLVHRLFDRPLVSHIYLDDIGSFLWLRIDGYTDIVKLGELLKTEFGNDAEPLYERLEKFFRILESYRLVRWK